MSLRWKYQYFWKENLSVRIRTWCAGEIVNTDTDLFVLEEKPIRKTFSFSLTIRERINTWFQKGGFIYHVEKFL